MRFDTPIADKRINFRIGVHVGDVMVRAGDLFGDGVNIAARLQTLARAGGLCVSGVTYDQVRKILPLSFTDLGAQTVKNIEEPIRAYEVKAQGEAASSALERLRLSVMVNPSRCPTSPPSPCCRSRTCPAIPSRSILRMGWLRRSSRRFRGSNGCS